MQLIKLQFVKIKINCPYLNECKMASCTCSFSSLVDQCSPCGTSSDYPTHVEVVTPRDFLRDVLGHLESYGISGDEAIHSELKLLLARAGILFTFFHCFALQY